jgi:uncharacterized protein (TIGR03000 family)
MTRRLTRALAVTAAVAVVVAWVGARVARADGHGPYDHDGGRWYADEERDFSRLGYDAYGTGRARESRFFYPAATGYYYGPTYSFTPPADYSYGAYSPSAPARDNTAHIRLIVPAGAKVWFGQSATQQTGAVRWFESPQLTPGKQYTYDVKVTWNENGKEMTRTRQVDVSANSNTTVDLTRQ